MMPSSIRAIAAALSVAVAVTACATSPGGPAQTGPQPSMAGQVDLSPVAKARADSARYPYTAADIAFMSNMIGHHAQAIAMANWAPTHGASQSVQTLAGRVINAQNDEIAIMQRWLGDRNQPVPDAKTMGMKHMMGGMEHVMLMPGMLTDEQMKQLDAARGKEFDKLFLTFMIQHHKGAISMVKELLGSYGAAQDETVFKFASDVNVDQDTEIQRMQKMLASITLGIPLP